MKTQFNFRKMMEKHGLRQIEVAKATGLNPATINNFFHGASYPSIKSVIAICNNLNVPVQDFFTIDMEEDDQSLSHDEESKKNMICPRCGYPIEVKLSLPETIKKG